MIEYILTSLILMAFLFVFYVIGMHMLSDLIARGVQPDSFEYRLKKYTVGLVFIIADVLLNYWLCLFWWDWPDEHGETITNRMRRYKKLYDSERLIDRWRFWWAEFLCERLLDKHDPSGDHC